MLPPVHRGNGTNIAVPDVCNTPIGTGTSPITYVNTADCSQSVGFSTIVMIANSNACNTSSQVPSTTGDEAGTAHYSIKGNSLWTAGSAVVMIESKPAVTLSSPTSQNKGNAVGATTVPSVSTVLFTRRPNAHEPETPPPVERLDDLLVAAIPGFDLTLPGRLLPQLKRPRGILLDLRGNPGGRLDVMTRLCGLFLPRDTPLVVREQDGVRLPLQSTRPPVTQAPLAVLVDAETASAAELFAAVMQHHGRARLFGAATWGKSQVLRFDRPDPEVVGRCLLPDGTDLQVQGVTPDVVIPAGDDASGAALAWLLSLCSEGDDR